MTRTHHLLSVWNPAYAVDAMDAHVSVLVELARRHLAGVLHEGDGHEREEILKRREELVGIGQVGLMSELLRLKMRVAAREGA
jgi:hypothetical protein